MTCRPGGEFSDALGLAEVHPATAGGLFAVDDAPPVLAVPESGEASGSHLPMMQYMVVGGDTDDVGGDEATATTRARQGVPVAYRGPDTDRDILNPQTQLPMLFHGHPGRITSPAVQHILVNWSVSRTSLQALPSATAPTPSTAGGPALSCPLWRRSQKTSTLLRKQRLDNGERPVP